MRLLLCHAGMQWSAPPGRDTVSIKDDRNTCTEQEWACTRAGHLMQAHTKDFKKQ